MHRLRALLILLLAATLPFSGTAWAGLGCCPQSTMLVASAMDDGTATMGAMDHAHMHHAAMAMQDETSGDPAPKSKPCCGHCADPCTAGACGFVAGLLPQAPRFEAFSPGAQRARAASVQTLEPHRLELNRPPIVAVT